MESPIDDLNKVILKLIKENNKLKKNVAYTQELLEIYKKKFYR